MSKTNEKPAKLGRGPSATENREHAIVSYCTASEASLVAQLSGLGKKYRSESDLMRVALAELVKRDHPEFIKDLRSDLISTLDT
jgi:hypothetical protein